MRGNPPKPKALQGTVQYHFLKAQKTNTLEMALPVNACIPPSLPPQQKKSRDKYINLTSVKSTFPS